jgi:cytochrome c peroxidase
MHDGRFQTLEEVIEHYNSGVRHSTTLDPIMTKPSKIYGLGLTITEKTRFSCIFKNINGHLIYSKPFTTKSLTLALSV